MESLVLNMNTVMSGVNPGASFWSDKKVLLTGHTGFKGSWLMLWLLKLGANVIGLSLAPESQDNLFDQLGVDQKIDHRIGDVRDSTFVKRVVLEVKPDIVLHLAAQPLVRKSYQSPVATWETNVMGTINILESLRSLKQHCAVVIITTDKVYHNKEWHYGYRESDQLGGHDPYSSSKAAAEIAVESWRSSFCGNQPHQSNDLFIASARAGNVIGGGDWSSDRIIPDAVRALSAGKVINVRNPSATRPWQHVLEPLAGYLILAQSLYTTPEFAVPFNFGPQLESNHSVRDLVEMILKVWPGSWQDQSNLADFHEASLLSLAIDRAHHKLGWSPRWDFQTTVCRTVNWYKRVLSGEATALECCDDDLKVYLNSF